jgi:hypothetical protein
MFYLKEKQKSVVDIANDPSYHTLVLIGSVGTGKTDVACHIVISICYKFPKTYWPVIRQNISTAKRSIIPSYLGMLDKMGFVDGEDYRHNAQDHEIKFLHNNSRIVFVEADISKDREGRKIKGINATGNHIDEADELDQTMFTTAVSRRGRHNEYNQPSISIITMNPNNTYIKGLYYDPWKAGTLPPGVKVIEFTVGDSWQSKVDIDAMMLNPKPWVERYINNNWDYSDDDNSLFKYRYFDSAISNDVDGNALRFVGYDVAREGTDRSVIALWYGRMLMDIIVVKDKKEQMTTDDQAMKLIKFMTQNAVIAQNVAVDGVGVGVGVIDHMHSKGIIVKTFKSGASPTVDTYDMLRSQVIYEFAQGLEKGTIKIYEGCAFRNELISEAMIHGHKIGDSKLAVESKDNIKKRTGGMSPDILDSVVMGLYPQLQIDQKTNTSRILY